MNGEENNGPPIVYAGSIPLDTDLLSIQRNIQAALGALAEIVLGSDTVVDRIGCTPGTDPYALVILPGTMTVLTQNDSSSFGALPADPSQVMRTGILPANTEVVLSAPDDAEHVLTWLIQARTSEQDIGAVVLPYWNAASPAIRIPVRQFGQAQATTRQFGIVVSAKSSGLQTPGEAGPPTPDAGCAGLFVVTTYYGKPGIALADIVPYAEAPRLRYTLATIPPAATTQAVFGSDSNWTVPALVRWVKVRAVGAGGGGGGGDTGYSGGGGGAGGYAEAILPVVPGQTYAVTIGVGGAGGQSGGSGAAGGSTFFGSNLVAATGGGGGGAGNPDSHGGMPGQGTAGTFLQSGGYGGDGAAALLIPGGNGGAGVFGGGGRGSDEGGVPAFGVASGSGGGGGYSVLSSGGAERQVLSYSSGERSLRALRREAAMLAW